jgi:hypothetical protein
MLNAGSEITFTVTEFLKRVAGEGCRVRLVAGISKLENGEVSSGKRGE